MPWRRPNESPRRPMTSGTIAPPIMPVQRIPENEPWWLETEFRASEKMIGHMTEAAKPIILNETIFRKRKKAAA